MEMRFALTAAAACLATLSSAFSTAVLADTTTRYSVLFSDHPSGAQVTTVRANGRVDVDFSYRNNGRGPDLKEQYEVRPDGTLVSFRVTGKSTFGAPVAESFQLKGNSAQWRSSADHGTVSVSGAAIYVPVDSSFEAAAIAIRAAAHQPDGRIAALPGGELRVEKVLDSEAEKNGEKLPLALYAITGIQTQPEFFWMTQDSSPRFFAFFYPGILQVIQEGWESNGKRLDALQTEAERQWLRKLADRLTHRVPDPILIRNVRVFDSINARLLEPHDVYVSHGHIAAVYPANSVPHDAATVIDGGGRVLMPALFDMHAHEDTWNLLLQIAGGVTTSRDMGNDNQRLGQIIAQIDAGELVAPRVIPCGFIEGDSQYSANGGFRVKDLQGAKDAVDWYAQHGYRQIKIYNSFHPEWVQETAAYAHQRGLRVSGHIPAFMRAEEAIRAGYDEVQHVNQMLLNFVVGPKDDTRTLARFYLIADNIHSLDLSSQRVTDFIDLLKQHGTVLDTTLTAFEGNFTQKQGEMNPSYAAVADHVPVNLQRQWRTNSMNVTDKNAATYRASYDKMVQFVGELYRAGVSLEAGTDDIAGFTLHRELELYVRAGIPAAEALRIATVNGARFTGTLNELGTIEPRKRADLILVDGDPTTNISDIRKISLVMKDGVIYFPAEVYEAVGVKRFTDPPKLQSASK